jgi:hypothetical protein
MSQTLHHLTLIILLLKIRLNSSASILRMESLTALESSMHITGSNITSFATLTGSLLAGYQTEILYTDATCSAVRYAESYPLNVCYPWIDGTSFYATSNGTHTAYKAYSDYSCAKLLGSSIYDQPLQICDQSYLSASVTASYPTIVSSSALLAAA